jgi:hypothetical protein
MLSLDNESEVDDLIKPVALLGLLFVSFLFGGFIDARLQRLHPEGHRRLGGVIHLGRLSRETFAHQGRWLRFIWYEHFRSRDALLSVLCVSAGALQVAFFYVLFIA